MNEGGIGAIIGRYPGIGAGDREAQFTWAKGRRFWTCNPTDGITDIRIVQCDLRMWQRPSDKREFVVRVDLVCPRCAHPLSFAPKPNLGFDVDEDGRISVQAPVECPAKWPEVRDGTLTGRWMACNWKAILRDGRAHALKCPCANFNVDHSPRLCACGGLLDNESREGVINAQGGG